MDQILTSEVYGRTILPNGSSQDSIVGAICSECSLESAVFEVVTLEFNKEYNGIESSNYNQGGSILTFAKSVGGQDRDIVSPIVMLTSRYRNTPIHVLVSGVISRINPPVIKKSQVVSDDGSCSIIIITPGRTPDVVNEWSVRIPKSIRIDRKIIFIKNFNIYIGGCSFEQMVEIRDGGVLIPETINAPKPVVDIHIRGYATSIRTVHFNFNGIFGKVNIEPSREPTGTVTLRVGGTILTRQVSNNELLNMDNSIYIRWEEFGGIDLLIDNDRDRLSAYYDTLKKHAGVTSPDAVILIRDLRKEIVDLKEKIFEKDTVIRDKDRMIGDLKQKVSDIDYKLKIEQEEFKTRREEIKYHGTIHDQRNAVVMDTIKLGGAILGIISVGITLASKANKTPQPSKSNFIEWAHPSLMKKLCVNDIAPIF